MLQTIMTRTRRKPLTLAQREERDFYLFIGLWLIGFILFSGGPILASLFFSFTNWTGLTSIEWIGLGNFQELLFDDKLFWTATRNTFFYSFGAVTLGTMGALFVAILMNQNLPGTTLLRVIYYLPSIASGVAISILWIWLFNPQSGLVNYALSLIGIEGPLWLASPTRSFTGPMRNRPIGNTAWCGCCNWRKPIDREESGIFHEDLSPSICVWCRPPASGPTCKNLCRGCSRSGRARAGWTRSG